MAISLERVIGQFFHHPQKFWSWWLLTGRQQTGFHGGCSQHFQITAANFRIAIFRSNHFTLLSQAYLALHGACRLRQYRLIAGATATTNRTAATMEQTQTQLMARKHLYQIQFRLIQFPARSQETAVLITVGITEHHFLCLLAAVK